MIKSLACLFHSAANLSLLKALDGVGKSTQMENLAANLRERGIDVITTREPGGTSLGEKLRTVLLSSRTAGLSPLTELALMFADRAQAHRRTNPSALQRGQWVLCDRFNRLQVKPIRAAAASLQRNRTAIAQALCMISSRLDDPDGL